MLLLLLLLMIDLFLVRCLPVKTTSLGRGQALEVSFRKAVFIPGSLFGRFSILITNLTHAPVTVRGNPINDLS